VNIPHLGALAFLARDNHQAGVVRHQVVDDDGAAASALVLAVGLASACSLGRPSRVVVVGRDFDVETVELNVRHMLTPKTEKRPVHRKGFHRDDRRDVTAAPMPHDEARTGRVHVGQELDLEVR
jgi:hypothetical protein